MTVVTVGDDGGQPSGVTFAAFAALIGKSRPYVSKLVALGRIREPALTADRKIIPDLARQQIAEMADPARAKAGQATGDADGTYASNRARLAAAQAERAEMEVQERRGELLPRGAIVETFGPLLRKLRDDILNVPRDVLADPDQADQCETALAAVLERTASEILSHGAAAPAA
jgi:phage terminase Nu1 subunit (DNA packaging protein)